MSEQEMALQVPWREWRRVTGLAARFAARDSWEPVIGCVHLVEIGGRLFVEATDRYSAGVVVAAESVVPPAGLDVTVPLPVLRAVRALGKGVARTVTLRHAGTRARVTVGRPGTQGDLSVEFVPVTAFPDLRRLMRKAPRGRSGVPVRPGLLGRFAVDDEVAVIDTPDVGLTVVQVGDGGFFGMVVRPRPTSDSTGETEPAGLRDLVDLYAGTAGGES